MSETSTSTRTTAHEVAVFLRRHPRFLRDYPDIALSLSMPREDGSTTSLTSYQLDVLRDKNRELNRRLVELFAVAQENERLTLRTHHFTLALMRARSASEALKAAVAALHEDFDSDEVRVLLFAPIAGQAKADWLRVMPRTDSALQPFEEFLAEAEPLCGRLNPAKVELLFGDKADQIQSSALLALEGRGLLAIGSRDANRFYPGMGTLFLRLMAEAIDAAVGRFEPS